MPKLPKVKGKELLKVLTKYGFRLDHIQGSHHIMRDKLGRKVTVPIHGNKEIPVGTLFGILRDIDMTKEVFLKLLSK